MTIPSESLRSLLDRAAAEPLGLAVEATNSEYFKQQLSDAKRSLADPAHAGLIIARTDTPNVLFIIKESVELE